MVKFSGMTMLVGPEKGSVGAWGLWHPGAVLNANPRYLTWEDVDPSRHRFDPGELEAFVRSCGPALAVPERPAHANREERIVFHTDPVRSTPGAG
jgi:hypothetical protein